MWLYGLTKKLEETNEKKGKHLLLDMTAKEVEVRKRNEEIEAITKDSENTKIILEEKIDAITTDSENTKTILEEKIDAITKDSESTKTILEDKLKDQGKKLKKHEKSITEFRKVNQLPYARQH